MTQDTDTPRLRRDGSIDTAFYMARGRRMRSEAAHRMVGHTPADSRMRAAPPRRGILGIFAS